MARLVLTMATAVLAAMLFESAALAIPAGGPRETVDFATGTTRPGASAWLSYGARFFSATDPTADPPPLRHLRIALPAGTRIDTSILPRCTASEQVIRLLGESACPAAARIGSGSATVRQTGLGVATFPTVIYNAPDDMLELIKLGDSVVGVVHTYIRGTTLDGPIPTCITGGQPPAGCPADQLTLLANDLTIRAITVGGRNYATTPATCPRSGVWTFPTVFTFADGSVDRVVPGQACRGTPPVPGREATVRIERRLPVSGRRTASARLACRGPRGSRCTGVLVLSTGVRGFAGRRASAGIGSTRFALPAGSTRSVRVRLSSDARAYLRRHRRLPALADLTIARRDRAPLRRRQRVLLVGGHGAFTGTVR